MLPGQVTLYDGQGRPLAGSPGAPATWPSTGTGVGLRYDGASRRYLLVRYQGRELRRDEIAE